jgi:hypothetical protein
LLKADDDDDDDDDGDLTSDSDIDAEMLYYPTQMTEQQRT